ARRHRAHPSDERTGLYPEGHPDDQSRRRRLLESGPGQGRGLRLAGPGMAQRLQLPRRRRAQCETPAAPRASRRRHHRSILRVRADRRVLLQLEGLTKAFGGLLAVSRVSFDVAEGEILGLLGPNGSGKTTLLNLVAGALRADAGRVRLAGRDITSLPASVRTRLGIARTFQVVRPLSKLSALDN